MSVQDYRAPLADMKFVLRELVDLDLLGQLPGFGEITPDIAESVLEEAEKFASGVLSPINHSGDLQGARWQGGQVLTAAGFKEAYTRFVADGWCALSCPGRVWRPNLPRALSAMIEEMWNGANLSFALCPMLTRGTVEAIELRGSAAPQGHVPGELGQRQVGRNHESDRAAGRFGLVGGAHPRGAHRRRALPGFRARRSSSPTASTT